MVEEAVPGQRGMGVDFGVGLEEAQAGDQLVWEMGEPSLRFGAASKVMAET